MVTQTVKSYKEVSKKQMLRVKVKDIAPSKELRERVGIDDIILILQQDRLRWHAGLSCKFAIKYIIAKDPTIPQSLKHVATLTTLKNIHVRKPATV